MSDVNSEEKEKVKIPPLSKFRKKELYSLYCEMISIMKLYDMEALRLNHVYDNLVDFQQEANLLRPKMKDEVPKSLTPEVNRQHELRLKYASTITNHMRTLEKADIIDDVEFSAIASFVYKNLNYLRKSNMPIAESRIDNFFEQLKEFPDWKEKLYEWGFKLYIDKMFKANIDFQKISVQRWHLYFDRTNTTPVQIELRKKVTFMLQQINFYQSIHLDIDYEPMIIELNSMITYWSKIVKTRETKRKNKK